MMNCFEARQDFVSFWQSALDGERRRELLAHLKGCARCDRAFRAFALTAPMLHLRDAAVAGEDRISAPPHTAPQHVPRATPHAVQNASPSGLRNVSQNLPIDMPVNMSGVLRADAPRVAEILRRASVYRLAERRPARPWREAAAGLSAVAAAVLLAYFSVAAPSQSFDEALTNSDSVSETVAQPDTDFLGQQMPTMPAMSNDLAG
jgi:hypothetical protein